MKPPLIGRDFLMFNSEYLPTKLFFFSSKIEELLMLINNKAKNKTFIIDNNIIFFAILFFKNIKINNIFVNKIINEALSPLIIIDIKRRVTKKNIKKNM